MRNARIFLVFWVLTAIISWYLVNARYQNYFPQVVFWVPVVCVLSLVAYQIIELQEGSGEHFLILVEILTLSLLMRTMFIPSVAFYGYDPYHEYLTAVEISKSGWTSLMSSVGLSYTIDSPVLHFLAISISEISGVSLLSVARFLPLVFAVPSILILFLISKEIFNSERVGLLTAFGFSMLYQSEMFYSIFVRESVAFVMFFITIYLYYVAIRSRNVRYVPLAILSSIVTVLSHHLTPFLLIIFFVTVYLSQRIVEKMGDFNHVFFRKIARLFGTRSPHFHLAFVLLLLASLLVYWDNVSNTPFQILGSIVNEASFISGGRVALIGSMRYWFILGGEIIFALVFGLLSLLGVYFRRSTPFRATSLEFAFIVWIALMGVFSVAFALGRIYPEGSFAVARRFQPFAYPFLFMLSGYAAHLKLKNLGFKRKIGAVLVFIFVLFTVFQLYSFPRSIYSDYRGSDEVRNTLLPEEYFSIFWLNTSESVATDWDIFAHAMDGFVGTYPYGPVEVFTGDIIGFRYLVVRNVGPYSLTEADSETLRTFSQSTFVNSIYSNGIVEVCARVPA